MNIQTKKADAPIERRENPFVQFYYHHDRFILGSIGVLTLLLLWEALARMQLVDPIFISSPSRIWNSGLYYILSERFVEDFLASAEEMLWGFSLAIIVGIPFGILMGWYPNFNYLIDPIVNFLYASPRIALVPLFIIWFGIGIGSKVAVIFLASFFPIVINTLTGVKTVDPVLLSVARSNNATDMQIFKTIIVPSSVPSIISGIRLGLGHALIGVVVGEMTAATKGVGYMMFTSGQLFQTDLVFVGLFIVAGLGVVLSALIQALERRFDKWRVEIHK